MFKIGDGVFQSIISDNNSLFSDIKVLRNYNLNLSPNQYFFHCPSPGDFISYFTYDEMSRNFYFNTLFNYIDFIDKEILNEYGINENQHPNSVHTPSYGDTYIGKFGRIYLNDSVIISSDNYRSKAYFWDDGLYENRSYNFKIRTEDSSVSIYTTSSDPVNKFGDSLNIEINKYDYSSFSISNVSNERINFDGTYSKKMMFMQNDNVYGFDMQFNSDMSFRFELGYDQNKQRFASLNINKDGVYFKTIKHSIQLDNVSGNIKMISNSMSVLLSDLSMSAKNISINTKEEISPIVLGAPGLPSVPALTIAGFLVIKLNGKEIKIPYSI